MHTLIAKWRYKMWKSLGCGIFVLLFLVACGADHSRNLSITINAEGQDSWVELDIESILEKMDNTEESVTELEGEGELGLQLTP